MVSGFFLSRQSIHLPTFVPRVGGHKRSHIIILCNLVSHLYAGLLGFASNTYSFVRID